MTMPWQLMVLAFTSSTLLDVIVWSAIGMYEANAIMTYQLELRADGDDSSPGAAAAEQAVKRACQGSSKGATEDVINALEAAEARHNRQQQGIAMFSASWWFGVALAVMLQFGVHCPVCCKRESLPQSLSC